MFRYGSCILLALLEVQQRRLVVLPPRLFTDGAISLDREAPVHEGSIVKRGVGPEEREGPH